MVAEESAVRCAMGVLRTAPFFMGKIGMSQRIVFFCDCCLVCLLLCFVLFCDGAGCACASCAPAAAVRWCRMQPLAGGSEWRYV